MKLIRGLLVLTVTLFLNANLLAQETAGEDPNAAPNAELKNFKNWSVQCVLNEETDSRACVLFHQMMLENGQRLLAFQIADTNTGQQDAPANYVAVITVPLGVHLPSGLRLEVDEAEPVDLVFERCDQAGCYAGTPLSETLKETLRKGKNCQISFNNLEGKTVKATVPLSGFTAGFNAL